MGGFGISIDPKLLEKLDKYRGDVPREVFLEKLLAKYSDKGAEDLIESETAGSEGKDSEIQSNDIDEAALDKIDGILSKMDKIDEMSERLNELEQKQATKKSNSPTGVKSSEHGDTGPDSEPIQTDSGEQVKTFQFSGEQKVEFESAAEAGSVSTDDETEEASHDSYDFVFGCWYCDRTVNESDEICPSCGNSLDGQSTGDEWLKELGRAEGYIESDDDWEDDGYYHQDGYYDDEYDPSKDRVQYEYPEGDLYSRTGPDYGSSDMPRGIKAPICPNCSGNTEYIHRYNRWYCYKCAMYAPETISRIEEPGSAPRRDRTSIIEDIMKRRSSKPSSDITINEKPLKYYGPYASSEAVTKISLVDSDKDQGKRKKLGRR